MNRGEVESKLRSFKIGETEVQCEIASCEACEFLKTCQNSDVESLRYKPDARSLGAELCNRTTLLPLIDTDSESRARKLYQVLIEMVIAERMKKRWNALDIAKNLGISVRKVRMRVEYLIERHFLKKTDRGHLEFSFGRDVHNLARFYSCEFKNRFGYNPKIQSGDLAQIAPLIAEYPDNELRIMISRYFDLNDQFLKDVGYSLRFFPSKINKILIDMSTKNFPKSASLTREQLEEYLKGKKESRWTGEEDWAHPYEKALKSLTTEP